MSVRRLLAFVLASQVAVVALGASRPLLDPAAAFGARPSLGMLSLSPDGTSIAYVAPTEGQGSILFTMKLGANPKAVPAMSADGKAWRLAMAAACSDAHVRCELVTFEGLDHQLDDSAARAQMLRKSDEFLKQSLAASH